MIVFVQGWRTRGGRKQYGAVSSCTYDDMSEVDDECVKQAMLMLDACDVNENGVKVINCVGYCCNGTYYIMEKFLNGLARRDKVKP